MNSLGEVFSFDTLCYLKKSTSNEGRYDLTCMGLKVSVKMFIPLQTWLNRNEVGFDEMAISTWTMIYWLCNIFKLSYSFYGDHRFEETACP